jgi:hypothetical protein
MKVPGHVAISEFRIFRILVTTPLLACIMPPLRQIIRARKRSLYNPTLMMAVFAVALISSIFTGSALGQDFKRPDESVPLRMDWSDQHVVYTVEMTGEQVEKVQGDPRFFVAARLHGKELADESARNGYPISGMRPHWKSGDEENRERKCRDEENRLDWESGLEERTKAISDCRTRRISKTQPGLKTDWSVSLGPTAGVPAGQSPAKFSFDVNGAPSCTADYVVFPVNVAPGSNRANVTGTFATGTGYSSGTAVTFTVTPTVGTAFTLTLTPSATVNTGLNFRVFATGSTANATTSATNLAAAINRNLSSNALDRLVAIPSTNTVNVRALTPGTRVVLTETENLNNLTFGTVAAGVDATQANIVGFNNLYSGSGTPFCTGKTFPTFTFSYASGVGAVSTSPVISLDGTKIAYVENASVSGLILHVLTIASGSTEYGSCTNTGTGTTGPNCANAPVIPGSTAGSTATDFMVPLSVPTIGISITDTRSSPFVNYTTDTLYVGDDNGNLYSVTGVFQGTPTLGGGNFPIAVSPGNLLTSPVVDVGNTGDIFIGDSASNVFDYTPAGVILGTQSIGTSTGGGIWEGAVVDSTNSKVYFATTCNTSVSDSWMVQYPFSTAGFGTAIGQRIDTQGEGCDVGALPQYNISPDSLYYTAGISSSSAASNGHIVVCYQGTGSIRLAQWGFASGAIQTTRQFDSNSFLTTGGLVCSPSTEFYGSNVAYTPTALTQSGRTVTVTTATNLFDTGQVVTMAGVKAGSGGCTATAIAAINGEQTVTVLSATQFTFTSAVTATIASGSCTLTGSSATGPTQDYVFFGTSQPSVFTFTLPMTSNTQTQLVKNTTSVTGGTSGIIVDNDSTSGQASSIYFGTQATSTSQCGTTAAYCAVKLTQTGLQ